MIGARTAGALALVTTLLAALAPGLTATAAPTALVVDSTAVPLVQEVPGVGSSGVEISQVSPVVAAPAQPVRISGTLDAADLGIDLSPSPQPTAEPTGGPTAGAAGPTADPTAAESATPTTQPDPVATVEIRLAPEPITDGAGVTAWAQSSSPSAGRLLVSQPIFAAPGTPTSGPGTTLPFSVAVDDLSPYVSRSYGIAPISLQVYLPGRPTPVRVVHTFLGFERTKEYAPLGITVVLPFTLPADPDLLGPFGDARATAWEALLGEESRLTEQLALAAAPGVVWAIDPTLLTAGPAVAATTPAAAEPQNEPTAGGDDAPSGEGEASSEASSDPTGTGGEPASAGPAEVPQTLEPDSTPGPAARERAAREAYVQRLLDAVRGRDVIVLPVADADLAVLPEAGDVGTAQDAAVRLLRQSLDVETAMALLEDAGARAEAMVWPADGMWSAGQDELLRAWDDGAGWGVLTARSSIAGGDPESSLGPLLGAGGTALIGYDAAAGARAGAAVRGTGPVLPGLTLMADTLMTLNDRPGTARHRVIVLDRAATLDEAVDLQAPSHVLAGVPWLTLGPIPRPGRAGALAASPPADTSAIAPASLTADRLVALGQTETSLEPAAHLRVNSGADLATRGKDTLGQLLGSRWRGAEEDWQLVFEPLAEQVDSTFSSIHIPARDIAFLADSGLVRVTVENSLDDGLHNATMDLSVDRPILRIESGPQPVDVGADSRSTVAFQASAISSGRVAVTAVVRSEDGTVLGEPTTFSVRVSPTSDWIYWLLGGLAAVVLLIGVVRTVLRRHPES